MPIVYEQLIPRDIIREANAGLIMSVKSKGANFMEDFPADDDLTFEGDRSLFDPGLSESADECNKLYTQRRDYKSWL